jgi:hypothetical protein
LIGLPVIAFTESAAPPRASPSSFVRTTPSNAIRSCLHQLLVDLQPPGGVDDHRVEAIFTRAREAAARRLHGVGCVGAEHRHVDLPAELLELVDRGGALEVGRDEPRLAPLLAQVQRELRRRGRLAGALEPGEQDDREPPEREPRLALPHQVRELVMDDLHDLLARREALQDLLAERLLADTADEVADDGEVDVRLEERKANLAHRTGDRLLVELAFLPQVAECALQLVGERVEHERAW